MKTLNLFVSLILVAILVTACGSAAPAPTSAPAATEAVAAPTDAPTAAPVTDAPTAAPAKSDVTLTYMASQDWIMDAEMELGKKFEEQTGIHIDYQIIPSDQ
jgi:raffinose/stachyose/melibiose transport system substrate-binding protein